MSLSTMQPYFLRRTRTLEEEQSEPSFVAIGKLLPCSIRRINSLRALCNCPVMAMNTAYYLENGFFPTKRFMQLSYPNIPRPMTLEGIHAKWVVKMPLSPDRRLFVLENVKRSVLELLLKKLGPGTHAIVGARGKGMNANHCFNYLCSETETGTRLIVFDNYAPRFQALGLNHPEKYLKKYHPEFQEVIVFHNQTDAGWIEKLGFQDRFTSLK